MASKKYKHFSNGEPMIIINKPSRLNFCDDNDIPLVFDDTYISQNQRFAGPANPKTLIAPIVVPPIAELEYWKNNNLTVLSQINTETQRELYRNGYIINTKCGNGEIGALVPERMSRVEQTSPHDFIGRASFRDSLVPPALISSAPIGERSSRGSVAKFTPLPKAVPVSARASLPDRSGWNWTPLLPEAVSSGKNLEYIDENDENVNYYERENYEPSYKTMHKYGNNICNIEDTSINTSCGYDNKQISNNLPSNYNASDCEKSDAFIEYNKQLFTQNVGENMYDVNQINEPINSNIGISFQQQFQPTTYNINKYGEKIYTEYDPTIFKKDNITAPLQEVRTDNVYDPRSFGYGTNYRNYNDELLGQPRFIYDDINAVRMPNYISRSNIDNNSFADSYGSLNSGEEFGNKYNSNIRELANKAWLDNTTNFREELSQRLMRKRNAEMWQVRKYPKGPHQK